MNSTMQLRSCEPIGHATPQPDTQQRNTPRNQERNSPRQARSLLDVIRNRQRNRGATGSCAPTPTATLSTQPGCALKFADLVRAFGTSWGFLFDVETILAELNQEDVAELETLGRHRIQSWAQMLAYRLSAERLQRGSRRESK